MERVLEVRGKDPATFAVFSAQTVAILAAYEAARTGANYTGKADRPTIVDVVFRTDEV